MNKNWTKILCAMVALLMLTGCRSGAGETTVPGNELPTTEPSVSIPEHDGVEEWPDPVETEPISTTTPVETTGSTEPDDRDEDPVVDPTDPTVAPTDPGTSTEPAPTTQSTTPPQTSGKEPAEVTYEEYLAMTPAQQQAHYEQFPSLEAYIAWHNAALEIYEENQSSIEVTGGIDIGDFITP